MWKIQKSQIGSTRVELGTPAENLTGAHPFILAKGWWYGKLGFVCARQSDERLFTVVPRGALEPWISDLEERGILAADEYGIAVGK